MGAVLDDHRGTEKWDRSAKAFKKIMRTYVHAGNESITDEELDRHHEEFLTLTNKDVKDFIKGQSCLPAAHSEPAKYYMVNSTHQRHDDFFKAHKTAQPRRVMGKGAGEQIHPHASASPHAAEGEGHGTKHMSATFTANLLLQRFPIDAKATMPPQSQKAGNHFTKWADIRNVMTNRDAFNKVFTFRESTQADEIFKVTQKMKWDTEVSGDLFMAPILDGNTFSPALFAVYLFRDNPKANASVFFVVSANGGGQPKTPFVGLVSEDTADNGIAGKGHKGHEFYKSVTGFKFDYISSEKNLLNYKVLLKQRDPLAFELWITTAFPDHPDKPYLTVRSPFVPAASQKMVDSFSSKGAKTIMMIRKGALMRDLIEMYYPDSTDADLWQEVLVLKQHTNFLDDLEGLGLDAAAGLFSSDLWLEKPTVGEAAPAEFGLAPGMLLKCETPETLTK